MQSFVFFAKLVEFTFMKIKLINVRCLHIISTPARPPGPTELMRCDIHSRFYTVFVFVCTQLMRWNIHSCFYTVFDFYSTGFCSHKVGWNQNVCILSPQTPLEEVLSALCFLSSYKKHPLSSKIFPFIDRTGQPSGWNGHETSQPAVQPNEQHNQLGTNAHPILYQRGEHVCVSECRHWHVLPMLSHTPTAPWSRDGPFGSGDIQVANKCWNSLLSLFLCFTGTGTRRDLKVCLPGKVRCTDARCTVSTASSWRS